MKQIKDGFDPGRYSRVSRRMWRDQKFRQLSRIQPSGQGLWIYLLTSPALGSVPGLLPGTEGGLADELGWSLEELRSCWEELVEADLAEADWGAGLIWLKNALRHNPPANPNVVLAWPQFVGELLPECPLLWRALASIREQLRQFLAKPLEYLGAFDAAFPPDTYADQPGPEGMGEGAPQGAPQPAPEGAPQAAPQGGGETGDRKQEQEEKASLTRACGPSPSSTPGPAQGQPRRPEPPLVGLEPPPGVSPTRPAHGQEPGAVLDALPRRGPPHPENRWQQVRELYLATQARHPSMAAWPEGLPGSVLQQARFDVTAQRLPMTGPQGWPGVLAAIEASPWARSEGGANPRWLMDPDHDRPQELLAGNYRARAPRPATGPPGRKPPTRAPDPKDFTAPGGIREDF